MPKSLLVRFQQDSIQQFRVAAAQRLEDALQLAASGRRTGALYLCGYSAEMVVKAAYFAALSFPQTRIITRNDLVAAANIAATQLNIGWPAPRNLHNVRAWCELLVAKRASTLGLQYPSALIGQTVVRNGSVFERLWSEVIRYRRNVAYEFEMTAALQAAEWFVLNSKSL